MPRFSLFIAQKIRFQWLAFVPTSCRLKIRHRKRLNAMFLFVFIATCHQTTYIYNILLV